jgi:hypothetical protein
MKAKYGATSQNGFPGANSRPRFARRGKRQKAKGKSYE